MLQTKYFWTFSGVGKSWPTFSPLELFGKFIKSSSLLGEGGESFYMILGFVNFCRRIKIDCSSALHSGNSA